MNYACEFDGQTITAASGDVDLFEFTPTTGRPVEIYAIRIAATSEVRVNQEEWLRLRVIRGHTTAGSGGATATANKTRSIDRAAAFTTKVLNPTVAAAGTPVSLLSGALNVRRAFRWGPVPKGQGIRCSESDGLLVIRLMTAVDDDVTLSAVISVREYGVSPITEYTMNIGGAITPVGTQTRQESEPGGDNNAPMLFMWQGASGLTGDLNNQPQKEGMSLVRLNGVAANRMIAGGGFIHSGCEVQSIRPFSGGNVDRYDSDGSTPAVPVNSARAWYQRFIKTDRDDGGWNGTSWKIRTEQLGLKNFIAFHTQTDSSDTGDYNFNCLWHSDTQAAPDTGAGAGTFWGGTGCDAAILDGEGSAAWIAAVDSAETPAAGSFLEDLGWLVAVANTAGFTGVYFDPETEGSGNSMTYPGKPGGQTEAQTRLFVKLRGAQVARVIVTKMPVPGIGPELGMYMDMSRGWWGELVRHIQLNGAGNALIDHYKTLVMDSFAAGLASEPNIFGYFQIDHTFYRGPTYGDTSANDDHVTKWATAFSYNINGRFARQSEHFTSDALRLESMRKTYRSAFMWPGDDAAAGSGAGDAQPPATWQVATREAVRWSMGPKPGLGKHVFYVRGNTSQMNELPAGSGLSSAATGSNDLTKYEAGWQAELIPGIADAIPPVCTITSPTSAATTSTAASTIVLGGTAADNQAIWYVEWSNAAVPGSGGACLMTYVITDVDWDPLFDQSPVTPRWKLPRNTSLGLPVTPTGPFAWRMDWVTEAIPLSTANGGVNVITVTVHDIHDNQHSDIITVTRTT